MNLTSQQIQAIRDGAAIAIDLPEVGDQCVVIRKDVFDRTGQGARDELPSALAIGGLIRATADEDESDDYREFKR